MTVTAQTPKPRVDQNSFNSSQSDKNGENSATMHATGNNSNNVLLVSHLNSFDYRHVFMYFLHMADGALCFGAVVKAILLSGCPRMQLTTLDRSQRAAITGDVPLLEGLLNLRVSLEDC